MTVQKINSLVEKLTSKGVCMKCPECRNDEYSIIPSGVEIIVTCNNCGYIRRYDTIVFK